MISSGPIAGLSIGGGRKENIFLCLIKYFPEKKRWFLTSLHQIREEDSHDSDQVLTNWVDSYKDAQLIVDFPLTKPLCNSCDLQCPGIEKCHHPIVKNIRYDMNRLLVEDKVLEMENPKKYEQMRNEIDQIDFQKDILKKETTSHILSKSFKRKLKKGYIPYWHRPLDFWLWANYYDALLNLFNVSYDSFGNVSTMLMSRLVYLKKHWPKTMQMYESNSLVVLIELMRANVISKKEIIEVQDMNLMSLARLRIIKKVEEKFNLFIYEHDLEIIVKNTKAFDSFLLSIAGLSLIKKKTKGIPKFDGEEDHHFLAPTFL
jgi:hypothetical protein